MGVGTEPPLRAILKVATERWRGCRRGRGTLQDEREEATALDTHLATIQYGQMESLAPRPTRALRALESLQESERRGVEGEVLWQGHEASLEESISRGMISDAMDAVPYTHGQEVSEDLLRKWITQLGTVPFDRVDEIRTEEVASSAMARSPDMWSRFEYPPYSTLLRDAAARIEYTIGELDRQSSSTLPVVDARSRALLALAGNTSWHLNSTDLPAIGTLLTGQFTAQVLDINGEGLVLLVEAGTFPLAKGLAQVGIIGANELFETGRLSEATVQAVSDLAANVAAVGHPVVMNPRDTPAGLKQYIPAVRDGLLMFVLAHEYSHILQGDLSSHSAGASKGKGAPKLDREMAADSGGLRLTLGATVDFPLPGAGLSSAMLFLAGQDLLERIEATLNHERPGNGDPEKGLPPYAQRAFRLLQEIEKSDELSRAYGPSLRLAHAAFHAVLFAWDIVMPALWHKADEFREISSAGGEGKYPPEFLQMTAMRKLWSDVKPRVADQRVITGL